MPRYELCISEGSCPYVEIEHDYVLIGEEDTKNFVVLNQQEFESLKKLIKEGSI